MLAITV